MGAERRKAVYDWLQEVGIDTKGGGGKEREGSRMICDFLLGNWVDSGPFYPWASRGPSLVRDGRGKENWKMLHLMCFQVPSKEAAEYIDLVLRRHPGLEMCKLVFNGQSTSFFFFGFATQHAGS